MNKELLLQIKALILADPEHFNMDEWANDCGTTCCISGHAIKIQNPDEFRRLMEKDVSLFHDDYSENMEEWARAGREALDLSEDEGRTLFLTERWPREFFKAFYDADAYYDDEAVIRRKQAAVAADRIDHFIATEGRE